MAPFAGNRVWPLLALAVLAATPTVAAVALASSRLAVHRTRRPLITGTVGLAAYFLLIGLLATAMSDFLRDNLVFARMAAQAGFAELGWVEGYVSALYSLAAIPIGAFAAGRIAATAADEAAGRLAMLCALPVHRARWAATEAVPRRV